MAYTEHKDQLCPYNGDFPSFCYLFLERGAQSGANIWLSESLDSADVLIFQEVSTLINVCTK